MQALGKYSVDVVINPVDGAQWPSWLEVLKPLGWYAVSGAIGGPLVALDVRTRHIKDLSLLGCTVLHDTVFPRLIRRIETGQVKPLVAKPFALSQLAKAQQHLEAKKHVGQLVIGAAGGK